MSKHKFTLFVFVLFVIIAALFWWMEHFEKQSAQKHAAPVLSSKEKQALPDEYPQLSLQKLSRKEAVREFNRNTKHDARYEWKIPIRFYGRVVDQFGSPVANASIHLQWVNLRGHEGVGTKNTTTDIEGLFSLDGVRGKTLSVKISKNGYYDVSRKENQTSFEYANPAENIFYEPDPSNPVVFLMRKKGEIESLIVNNLELRLSGQGATETIDLLAGKVSQSGGQLQVTVWKPDITTEQISAGKVFPYDWRVQIKINNGGLVENKDIFPFEAPESGYITEYVESLHAVNGGSLGVSVNKEFYFYFGEPKKYGRMHFRTDGDRPLIFIDYWLNPSGSRNLEYDSKQKAKAP